MHNVLAVKNEYDRNLPDSDIRFMDSLLEDILTADHIRFLMLKALDVERTIIKTQGKESQERDQVKAMKELAGYRMSNLTKEFEARIQNPEALKMFLAYNIFLSSKTNSKKDTLIQGGEDAFTIAATSTRLLREMFWAPNDQSIPMKEMRYLAEIEENKMRGKYLGPEQMAQLKKSSEMSTFRESTSAVDTFMKENQVDISKAVVEKIRGYISSF